MPDSEVLPTMISASRRQPDLWSMHLDQLQGEGIRRFACFLTGLEPERRKLCYARLESIKAECPFVHARTDMEPEEYLWLIEHCGTQRFNVHPLREWPLLAPMPDEARAICSIENSLEIVEGDVDGFDGVCLDLSHCEESRLRGDLETYEEVMMQARIHGVRCNHVSAVCSTPQARDGAKKPAWAPHTLEAVEEVDYVADYAPEFVGRYVALELKNPIAEQLEAKRRIEAILATATSSS